MTRGASPLGGTIYRFNPESFLFLQSKDLFQVEGQTNKKIFTTITVKAMYMGVPLLDFSSFEALTPFR